MSLPTIQQVKGYHVLPVSLPTISTKSKASLPQPTLHYMYFKKHVTKTESDSKTRSLFIINVPLNSTFTSFKKLFEQFSTGSIIESFKSVEFNDPNNLSNYETDIDLTGLSNPEFASSNANYNDKQQKIPVGCGVLTFLDKDALNLALTNLKKLINSATTLKKKDLPKWKVDSNDTGVARYSRSEKLDSTKLSIEVSTAMAEFTNKELKAIEEINSMKETVDEDGFTLVVGSHRKTKNSIMGSLKKKSDLLEDKESLKKMKKKEKMDFYRFQIRERKKQEMNDLLSKFKEDQQRVKQMKDKRKFKPY